MIDNDKMFKGFLKAMDHLVEQPRLVSEEGLARVGGLGGGGQGAQVAPGRGACMFGLQAGQECYDTALSMALRI